MIEELSVGLSSSSDEDESSNDATIRGSSIDSSKNSDEEGAKDDVTPLKDAG